VTTEFADLERSDLFAGLDPVSRRSAAGVLAAGASVRLAAGRSAPLVAGTAGFAIVAAGQVEVTTSAGEERQVCLAVARGGDVLVAPPPSAVPGHDVEVRALAESVVARVDHEQIRALAGAPQVLLALLAAVAARAEEAQAAAVRLAHRRVQDRVLLALRALAAREGRVTRDGVHLGGVRHRDLARLANVTRPGATRALAMLCSSGEVVRLPGGELLLASRPAAPDPIQARADAL
jgi:CRP-like cAMP-binding protein